MNEEDFHKRWSDRVARYPNSSRLPDDRPIHIHIDPRYAKTYADQVATITAASLFSRMCRRVAVDVPSLPVLNPLPWAGMNLDDLVVRMAKDAHRYGEYEQRAARPKDLRVVVGPKGDGLLVHGSGWGAYSGFQPSPVVPSDESNPFRSSLRCHHGCSATATESSSHWR